MDGDPSTVSEDGCIVTDFYQATKGVNPFDITKANDFTNDEIEHTWVDLPGGGLSALISPGGSMPRFLIGGKGGGRTHLMRHQSFSLQALRATDDLLDSVLEASYVGIYLRCAGLNASRFSGKGQSPETWSGLFAYYMDVWLSQLALGVVRDLVATARDRLTTTSLGNAASEILALFDEKPPDLDSETEQGDTASGHFERLLATLQHVQRDMDVAINNAAITKTLNVRVLASPGRLVFGIPRILASHIKELSTLRFVYLLDEFENLDESQQQYVNTLVREKELPSTFVIGSRLFGIRTHTTLSAKEENRQGSEFDELVLENIYREGNFGKFCRDMIRRRLRESRLPDINNVDELFETDNSTASIDSARAAALVADYHPLDRPYLVRLRERLHDTRTMNDGQIDDVVGRMAFPEHPMAEKFAILEFYREWARSNRYDIVAADKAADTARSVVEDQAGRRVASSFKSYAPDLLAQLHRDCKVRIPYYGLPSFISMSGYLPRNLLIILKQITRWSMFLGEIPFQGTPISLQAQREGVREASDWFFADAKALGRVGEDTQKAMGNVGSLLRALRYADKPVEISVSSFSTSRVGVTSAALGVLDTAVQHSQLLEISGGHRTKNSEAIEHKYQVNPMLAPKFDLPLSRRGTVSLTASEMNALFDPASSDADLRQVQRARMLPLNAPFGNARAQGIDKNAPLVSSGQDELPGIGRA
jgi:hypothetical protein